MKRRGFTSISIDRYVELHMRSNPGDSRKRLKAALESALRASMGGVTCRCGNPIWVIGSALAGNACFTCITGESFPDEDYEIDEALS